MPRDNERKTSRRNFLAAAVGLGSIAALGACAPEKVTATPAPTDSETPTAPPSAEAPKTIGYELDPSKTDIYKDMSADDREFLDAFYGREIDLKDVVGAEYGDRQHQTTLLALVAAEAVNKKHNTDLYGIDSLSKTVSEVEENPELAVDSSVAKFDIGFKLLQTYAQEQKRLEGEGKTISPDSTDADVIALLDRHRFATAIIAGDLRYTLSDPEDDSYQNQKNSEAGKFTQAMMQAMADLRDGKTTGEVNMYDYIATVEDGAETSINPDAYLNEDNTEVTELTYQNERSDNLGNKFYTLVTPDKPVKLKNGQEVSMWSLYSIKKTGFVAS